MSYTWLISGTVHEKPRLPPFGEYNGEDVYSPNQPTRGQIDEMLMNFSGKSVLVLCFDPTGCQSPEEVAKEIMDSVMWAFESRRTTVHEIDGKLISGSAGG